MVTKFLIYSKMAWRVLRRNPFYTAVNLFGISFTLAILMLMVAWYFRQFGAYAPLSNADSLVYMQQLQQKKIENDTIWTVDSTLVNGVWIKDSTSNVVANTVLSSQSGFSMKLLTQYFSQEKLTTAQKVTLISQGAYYDVFRNNKKYNLQAKHVDASYFQIFDFPLLAGRYFVQQDIMQRALHIIITEQLALQFFGSIERAIGQEIELDNTNFTVVGIIKGARVNNAYLSGDVFLPLSYIDYEKESMGYFGGFVAVVQCKANNTKATLDEISRITENIPLLSVGENMGMDFNFMKVLAYNHVQLGASQLIPAEDPDESKRIMLLTVGGLLLMFCMVPMLNLVNLNISRIMERSAEIGVRKAFGASDGSIRMQMIFENVILTLLGGVIGILIAWALMRFINNYGWLDQLHLQFNVPVFLISLLVTVLFGVVSGVWPAQRIARLPIVQALKSK